MLSVETYPTLAEASGAMTERSRFLAGGTLVMRAVNYGDQGFDRIIRSKQVERDIRSDTGGLRIGAGATMADVLASRDLAFLHPVARQIGGPAIRNMATVGGNLFAQNPYGDFATALLALDAQIVMVSGQSEPIEGFLAGRNRPRGLVAAIIVPRVTEAEFRFAKVSRVKPKGVSMLCLAAWLRASGGRLGEVRLAWGGMGPTPLRAKAAERALNGVTLDAAGIAPALRVATEGLAPVDDPLASAWYRQQVAPVHLRRLLLNEGRR
jgi:CO/xanthine dehydrogenase FAD-binding subunit